MFIYQVKRYVTVERHPASDGRGTGRDYMVNICVMGRRAHRIVSPVLAGAGHPVELIPGCRTFEGGHEGRREYRYATGHTAVHHENHGILIPVSGIVVS